MRFMTNPGKQRLLTKKAKDSVPGKSYLNWKNSACCNIRGVSLWTFGIHS